MTKTAAQIFTENPVDFMQNNFVTPGDGTSMAHRPGLLNFTLTPQPGNAVTPERPGALLKKYAVHPTAKTGADVFKAYWCPYVEDSCQSITVGRDGNFMFTAVMNGCSFGVGSANGSGGRMVAHINLKSQSNMAGKQNNILKGMRLGEALVDPGIYMAGDKPVHVTTFGVRDENQDDWRFFYQLSTIEQLPGATHNSTIARVTVIGVMPIL